MLEQYQITYDVIIRILLLISGLIVAFLILWNRSRNPKSSKVFEIKTDKSVVTSEDILAWFSSEENAKIISGNDSLLPLCFRGEELNKILQGHKFSSKSKLSSKDKQKLLAAIYDKKNENIVKGILFLCDSLSEDLVKIFGTKDMVVFK